jgi:hypothetical protein
MVGRDNVMNIDAVLKERALMVGQMLSTVEVDSEFWNEKNPIWQVPNNHVMLMMRTVYWNCETDEEFKKVLGPVIDKMVWLYISFPEWRARVGWMTWFLQLYVMDKQFQHETGAQYLPEHWNDPRKWVLAAEQKSAMITTVVSKKEGKLDDDTSGLATEISH